MVVLQVQGGEGWRAFRRYRTRSGGQFHVRYPVHSDPPPDEWFGRRSGKPLATHTSRQLAGSPVARNSVDDLRKARASGFAVRITGKGTRAFKWSGSPRLFPAYSRRISGTVVPVTHDRERMTDDPKSEDVRDRLIPRHLIV